MAAPKMEKHRYWEGVWQLTPACHHQAWKIVGLPLRFNLLPQKLAESHKMFCAPPHIPCSIFACQLGERRHHLSEAHLSRHIKVWNTRYAVLKRDGILTGAMAHINLGDTAG